MKKTALISLLVMSLGAVAFAGSVHAGFEAGADYTMVNTYTVFQYTSETGKIYYDFMIPIEYRFNDRISLASGFHWSARASQYTKNPQVVYSGSLQEYPVDDFMRVRHFLEFPLTVRVHFPVEPVDVFLGAGGFIGVYVGVHQYGKVRSSTFPDPVETSEFASPEAENNSFSAGLLAEVGVSYALGPGDLYLVGRYSYSLTGLMKTLHDSSNTYFSNLTLGAGYTFKLDGSSSAGGER